jgi:acyl-coenzyme A thioesterase PaaI-like protein
MAAAASGASSTKVLAAGRHDFGPTMMALTDFAMYVAILASIGPVPLAVTTNLNINFLRKPAQRDLIAESRLIKLGKRLAVGEVEIYSRRRGRDGGACDLRPIRSRRRNAGDGYIYLFS